MTAVAAADLSRIVSNGMSSSSCTTMSRAGVEPVEPQQRRDRPARDVHERVRLREDELRRRPDAATLGDARVRLVGLERRRQRGRPARRPPSGRRCDG